MPIVTPGGGSGGSQPVLSRSITLTDAEIKALPTTFQTIVPAPGVGFAIGYVGGFVVTEWSVAHLYTNLSEDFPSSIVYLGYADDFQVASLANEPHSVFGGAASSGALVSLPPYAAASNGDPLQPWGSFISQAANVEDAPLKLIVYNTAGDFTGGDPANTLTVTVLYTILPIASA